MIEFLQVRNALRAPVLGVALLSMAGCISIGEDPPPSLLTLTPAVEVQAGAGPAGETKSALLVLQPETPSSIAVTRVPVQIDDSRIAYLQDTVWVERPARLFQTLLIATIRQQSGRLVFDDIEGREAEGGTLRGTLSQFGYDARTGSVVVTYDAIQEHGGQVKTQRFVTTIPDVPAESGPVGEALNEAANTVAQDVADWVNS